MNQETKQFVLANQDADIHLLSLHSARFPFVDMSLAIRQINGKQKIKTKIPSFFENNDLLYPVQISLEQTSSESTAKYKSSLCEGNTLVDLTGGFGTDCYFLSKKFKQIKYVELDAELCKLAKHNFKVLGQNNIEVVNNNSEKFLAKMEKVDWIYIDPARRNKSGKKMFFLSDCEPDVSSLSTLLLEKASNVMIKLSPMLDITAAVRDLPNTSEIHIISVENECKEILLILNENIDNQKKIKTLNIRKSNDNQIFDFNSNDEANATAAFTSIIEKYLYEPNASIMKSGAFKLIGEKFGMSKLHNNTHLYTSTNLIVEFPGRVFEVQRVWNNSKKELIALTQTVPNANISIRNYPITVEEFRNKMKIKDGGDVYLIATTLANDKKVIIQVIKAISNE
jgi:16S rRNA G966 N2-methylase RsmD